MGPRACMGYVVLGSRFLNSYRIDHLPIWYAEIMNLELWSFWVLWPQNHEFKISHVWCEKSLIFVLHKKHLQRLKLMLQSKKHRIKFTCKYTYWVDDIFLPTWLFRCCLDFLVSLNRQRRSWSTYKTVDCMLVSFCLYYRHVVYA